MNWDNAKNDTQRFVNYYIKDEMPTLYKLANPTQVAAVYKRFGRAAKECLEMAGDYVTAVKAYGIAKTTFKEKGLSWNLNTLARHMAEIVNAIYSAEGKK